MKTTTLWAIPVVLLVPLVGQLPAGAEEPEVPSVRESSPPDPLVKVTPKQMDEFLDRFQVSRVDIRTSDPAALKDDAAVKGILGQVMDHREAAPGQAKGAGAPGAAPGAAKPAQRDAMEPDLPELFAPGEQLKDQRHLIFYDPNDTTFSERWEKQTRLLRDQLAARGVPAGNIQIAPVENREDFFCVLAGSPEGSRNVYYFGHGSPLIMHIGNEDVRLNDDIRALQDERVRLVAHYGCSFVDVNPEDVRAVQRQLQEGTRITLVGHRDGSTPYDDRWWDPGNPLARVNLTRDNASMHFVQDELRDRVVPAIGALLGAPQTGILPAAASAGAHWTGAEHFGRPPISLEREAQNRRQAVDAASSLGFMGAAPAGGLVPAAAAAAAAKRARDAQSHGPDDDGD